MSTQQGTSTVRVTIVNPMYTCTISNAEAPASVLAIEKVIGVMFVDGYLRITTQDGHHNFRSDQVLSYNCTNYTR